MRYFCLTKTTNYRAAGTFIHANTAKYHSTHLAIARLVIHETLVSCLVGQACVGILHSDSPFDLNIVCRLNSCGVSNTQAPTRTAVESSDRESFLELVAGGTMSRCKGAFRVDFG